MNAKESMSSIEKANKSLIDANKLSNEIGKKWALFFLVLAFILLIYDYVSP